MKIIRLKILREKLKTSFISTAKVISEDFRKDIEIKENKKRI